MNVHRDDNHPSSSCYFHPDIAFVGVCPLCLNERLVVLAEKQSHARRSILGGGGHPRRRAHPHHDDQQQRWPSSITSGSKKATPMLNMPKIFAIGSLLNRLEFRHWRTDSFDYDPRDASSSPEDDSFLSMKLEDNGVASWEKHKVSLDNRSNITTTTTTTAAATTTTTTATTNKSVIEHSKPRVASLRWRRRIGHLFHVMRWKRSSKAGGGSTSSVCHVGGKVEGHVKVRSSGWIRSLTKTRTAKQY